jgi:uncharacterized membrane protein YhaH (DUF805 family)
MNFEQLFVDPRGRAPREAFVPALLVVVAVTLFYAFLVKGRTAQFCLLVLVYPALVLHARRLHDMGRSAWLLIVPAALLLFAFAIRLEYLSLGPRVDGLLPAAALAVSAGFALWCTVGRSRA